MNKKIGKKGFTLVELLLVIGIIATLAVVVFVALDPAKRFQDARNVRRTSDVETILNAVHQYVIDQKGSFPSGLTANNEQILGTAGSGCASSDGGCSSADACLDIATDLSKYLKAIPNDPADGSSSANTGYSVLRDTNGIVTVRACNAEGTEVYVSR